MDRRPRGIIHIGADDDTYTFSCLACGNPLRAWLDTDVDDIRVEPCPACLEHERSIGAKKAEGG